MAFWRACMPPEYSPEWIAMEYAEEDGISIWPSAVIKK